MDQIFNHYGKIIGSVLGIIIVIAIIYTISGSISDNSVSVTNDLYKYIEVQMETNETQTY